jgi:1-acyl-sn-glycerol-3-phosphate acyltransferase
LTTTPQPSLARRIFNDLLYRGTRSSCRLVSLICFDFRIEGQSKMPASGPVLVLCNHQSNFDPVLIGTSFERRLTFLAKRSLFNVPGLRFLIESYDAVPIDRDKGGLEGLRAILAKLKEGKAVLIFPEGTRSRTGALLPIKGGFLSVARRSQATLLPMSLVGGSEVLTRESILPRRRPIASVVGDGIPFTAYEKLSDTEVVELVANSMKQCWDQAHALRETTSIWD